MSQPTAEPAPSNGSTIVLLLIVLAAIVAVGYFAFVSAPPAPK